ncbi:MAG: MFS transporter [Acidimicrobiales bacterium]
MGKEPFRFGEVEESGRPASSGATVAALRGDGAAQGRGGAGQVTGPAGTVRDLKDRRLLRLLSATSFAHFFNDGVIFFVPVIGDLLSQSHRTSAAVVTAMLTLFYITSAGFGLLVGLVADAIGRRGAMIALGIGVLGVSMLGFYLSLLLHGAGSDVLVLIAAVVAGVGSSFYHPLGGSILQLNFRDSSRATALGINGAFGSIGRALYPALFFVVAAFGITKGDTTAVFGGLSLLAGALVAFGLPTRVVQPGPATSALRGTAPQAGHLPAKEPGKAASDADGPARRQSVLPQGTWSSVKQLLNRSVLALMTIAFFRSIAFIGIVSWVPIYLTTQRHAGISSVLGYAVTVMYAGGILGQPAFGLLADRFDKRLVLAVDSLGSAGGAFLFLSTSGHGASALLALLVFGFFTFSGFPLLMSLVADYVPKESSTTGNALVWGLGSTGGQALGPLVASLLMAGSYSHLGTAFAVLAALAAATVVGVPLMSKAARHGRMGLFS